jgi:hypothetical protein
MSKTREQLDKEERRRKYLAIMFAEKEKQANRLPFKTHEEEVYELIGDGCLLSKLSGGHMSTALKLCEYPRNHTLRPKFITRHTQAGTYIEPYPKPNKK